MYLAPVQPPRQRLPHRVYATRRAVAGIVIVAILFLVYSVVTAVFAGPSAPTEAAPTRTEHVARRRRCTRHTPDRSVDIDVDHRAAAEGEDRSDGRQSRRAVRRRRQRRRYLRALSRQADEADRHGQDHTRLQGLVRSQQARLLRLADVLRPADPRRQPRHRRRHLRRQRRPGAAQRRQDLGRAALAGVRR